MRERAIKEQADARQQMDAYIRETARRARRPTSCTSCSELKDKGAISDAEFDRAKAKLLA